MSDPLPYYDVRSGFGFDQKARASQLAILFLLASGLRGIQEELYKATWSLGKFLDELALEFAKRIDTQSEPNDALLIWDSFTMGQKAGKVSGEVLNLLAQGRATIDGALQVGFDPRLYLAEANKTAGTAIGELAKKIGWRNQTSVKPAAIRIYYREGKEFWWPSSVTESGGRIDWVFQSHISAMWGAMLAGAILQHEYLSHLLPRSNLLPDAIREGWLMEVLRGEIRDASRAELGIFAEVRNKLRSKYRPDGPYALGEVADVMEVKRPALYRSFTRELLMIARDDVEPVRRAEVVLGFLRQFTRRSDLRAFLEDPSLTGLESLYAAVSKRQG